jgi:hypothetical protein
MINNQSHGAIGTVLADINNRLRKVGIIKAGHSQKKMVF